MCSLFFLCFAVIIAIQGIRGVPIDSMYVITLGLFGVGSAIEQLATKFKK